MSCDIAPVNAVRVCRLCENTQEVNEHVFLKNDNCGSRLAIYC